MKILFYTLGILLLTAGLVVFSYLDRMYRELGRVSGGRLRRHLESFESEIEPVFKMDRRRAAIAFSLLARLWLVIVAVLTAGGVVMFVPAVWEETVEGIVFLGAEVVVAMQLFPALLMAGKSAGWIRPIVPMVRLLVWITWPIHAGLDMATSVLRLSDEESTAPAGEQQGIEALVDAATEEGLIEQDDARLIEQVIEFGDKRVRDVMTPRPDVIAIPAKATLEELRERVVETKYSRLPVYDKALDDIVGIAFARDMLEIAEKEAARRTVREIMRPALFVPETKFGSELLKEMQRKNQQMAVVIDEYGLVAGIVTVEDLVEEIVGEIGEEDRHPAPDVIRESGGALVLRGSVPVDKLGELFGVQIDPAGQHVEATTVAGLLNGVAGHVPRVGEIIEFDRLRFDVLEANQRKVLRVRARHTAASAAAT
ncbi:MAG: HlyC/CorC family transporter [Acidobacteriota bacterium]|nr:HlyC/CorC family transporter [Acidobacteriota bacterium]